MSIRNSRLSADLRDVISLNDINEGTGTLSNLTENIDKSITFKPLIVSNVNEVTTLAKGISALLDTGIITDVGSALLGSYVSKTEVNLLGTIDTLSGTQLKRLDRLATSLKSRVINKSIPLTKLVTGYSSNSDVYSIAISSFLAIETMLTTNTVEDTLIHLLDFSEDSWYNEFIGWIGYSLLAKKDYEGLAELLVTIDSVDYESILEDLYLSVLMAITETPKDLATAKAIEEIVNRVNSSNPERFVAALDRFRPTREKLNHFRNAFKVANRLPEVLEETAITFRASDVIQVKLI